MVLVDGKKHYLFYTFKKVVDSKPVVVKSSLFIEIYFFQITRLQYKILITTTLRFSIVHKIDTIKQNIKR